MDNKAVSHETLRSTNIFLSVYLLIFCGSILIVSLDNFDLVTNFTAVAAVSYTHLVTKNVSAQQLSSFPAHTFTRTKYFVMDFRLIFFTMI